MAFPSYELAQALYKTADRLEQGADYAWGNHGSCNCGNLLQVITPLTREEILQYAHTGIGEWTELAQDYCPVSNAPVDLLVKKLTDMGLTPTDIHHLEYLDDKAVLSALPGGFRWLKRNQRADVVLYFRTFAQILENQWLEQIPLPWPPAETKVLVP
ncbi:MAG: hypothetical protein EAZ62_00130 [Sphingobacteriia bacterium]|nr:MAG: hypothetical protein EAZ62_00130 [Sphingobacteriia bacterium]